MKKRGSDTQSRGRVEPPSFPFLPPASGGSLRSGVRPTVGEAPRVTPTACRSFEQQRKAYELSRMPLGDGTCGLEGGQGRTRDEVERESDYLLVIGWAFVLLGVTALVVSIWRALS